METLATLHDPEALRLARVVRAFGLIAAPLLAALTMWLAPANMAPRAAQLVALLAATLVLWLSQALPVGVTALAAPAIGALAGIAEPSAMFAPFAHPTVWLLFAIGVLGVAAEWRGLDRALAVAMFSSRRTSLRDLASTIAIAAFVLSTWLPTRAVTALMATVVQQQDQRYGQRFRRLALTSVGMAVTFGGLVLPIGAPANLIALAALSQYDGRDLPLLHWTLAAAPVAVVLLAVWLLVIRVVLGADGEIEVHGDLPLPPDGRRPRPPTTQMLRLPELPAVAWRLDRSQLAISAIIATMLGIFAIPGLARLTLDPTSATAIAAALPPTPVALVLVTLLFLIPIASRGDAQDDRVARGEFTRRVDWEVLLLVGSGLALGHQTIDTGLSQWLGDLVVSGMLVRGELGLTFLLTLVTLGLCLIASAPVCAAIAAPLAVVAAQQLALSPAAPCLAVGIASSFGMLLPGSGEAVAMLGGRGGADRRRLWRTGLLAAATALVLIPPLVVAAVRLLRL